jgi:hypothetical protein
MKRLVSGLILIVAAATLSGCYYDPGYSYVRGPGPAGDAYYGDGGGARYVAPAYDGYYGDGYYGGGGYYDYGGGGDYGCCYSPGVSVGISSTWYGGSRYRRDDDYRGHRDYDNHAGHWQGRSDGGDRRGDARNYGGQGSRGDSDRGSHGGGQDSRGNSGGQGSHGRRDGNRGRRDRGDDRH